MRDGQEMLGQYVMTSSGGCSTCEPQLGQRSGILYDLRPPDFAGARHLHPVALAYVLRGDQLGVVQRGVGDGDATDLDRLEHRIRIERAGPAHVDADLEQLRDLHFGRELARHRPARLAVADRAQLGVERALVDFDGDTVGAVVERREQGLELGDGLVGGGEVVDACVVRFDRQSPFPQLLQQLVLRVDPELQAGGFDLESEDAQSAGARLFRIELPQRAGRGVARIRVRRLARLLALFIGLRELTLR